MNTKGGPAEACRAPGLRSRSSCFGGVGKEGALADSAEEMKDITTVRRGGFMEKLSAERAGYRSMLQRME